jgi:hypothetical protein
MLCATELIRLDLNYLRVATTWCRVAHLFPSKHVLRDVKILFLFFICGGNVDSSIFCCTTKVQLYCKKLLKIWQISYTLMTSCCPEVVAPGLSAWLCLGVQCKRGYVAWLSCATPYGTTSPGPLEPGKPVAWLGVTPQGLAWLLERHQSRQTEWHDWCNARSAYSTTGLTGLCRNKQFNICSCITYSQHKFTNSPLHKFIMIMSKWQMSTIQHRDTSSQR